MNIHFQLISTENVLGITKVMIPSLSHVWATIFAVIFCCGIISAWVVSSYDTKFDFACKDGEHIYSIESKHANSKEDRLWSFLCRPGYVSTDCAFTVHHVNSYYNGLDYKCPDNTIITGVSSEHKDRDRIWKYRCCKLNTLPGTDCYSTNHINHGDEHFLYEIPYDESIVGFKSDYDDPTRGDSVGQRYVLEDNKKAP
ncbi:millepora cytotoxin-1-like [Tubulanus polymorphus]|uniref:millepora cytotoxin-1-like n=1 Tax=Tubulanus polymorphus TaxID=672921 RepID=UPI003DA68354